METSSWANAESSIDRFELRKQAEEVASGYNCDVCRLFVLQGMTPFGHGQTDYQIDKAWADWNRHTKSKACTHYNKVTAREGNGRYMGAWAFTLTMSPKDHLTVGDLIKAARKVMNQKSCPVKKYAWYYEDKGRDENGDPLHPHIHGMYETETGGRVEKKHFKRAWEIWDESKPMGAGFRGGYHRPVKNEEGYEKYIKKDGGMSESYGIEQTE